MSKNIKVAFFAYPSAFQNIGGGEILLFKTKEYLEKLGIHIKLFDIWNDKLENFDILHIFGAVKDCLGLMQTARNIGLKIVLTPITFYTFQMALHEYGSVGKKTKMCLRYLTKTTFPYFPSDRRKMMFLADAVIPNSEAESRQLKRFFAIIEEKMHIIPNCVDESFEYGDKNEFISKYKVQDFVLSVGRIEPRKNQLNLIKALKGFGEPLIIIGDPVSDYMEYYNECRKQSAENVIFINAIDHEATLLKSAYKACRCFISQGWLETPGLAALEAGLAGANIATTDKGCTREYFRDFVEYFNPADIKGIRKAAGKALHKEKNLLFKEHIRKHFLWDIAAKKNLDVYERILA